jgi:phenylacetic acid degradation operon negative regulatory protein
MDAKTEELLGMMLWTCEMLSRPSWRNLTESFEGWAYRNGFHRQLRRLEKQQWLERQWGRAGDRLHRLSEAGRLHALGGRDPIARWSRRWDGRWRLVLFDVPEDRSAARNKLRQYLQSRGFGFLQNSVWITPDPVKGERSLLADGAVDVESLLFLEARPCAGESDAQIVAGAWDFAEIERGYEAHHKVLARRPHHRLGSEMAATAFYRWLREEHAVWQEAFRRDPLLPAVLLPPDYRGREAWRQRVEALAEAGEQMRTFRSGEASRQ